MKFLRNLFVFFVLFAQFLSIGVTFANTTGNAQFLNLDLNSDSINDRINFGPFTSSTAVVTVTDTDVTGNAWGESIGWVNFGPFTSSTAGVKNVCDADGNGLLSGYAFGENAGWINFGPFTSSTAPTVKIDVADGGKFKGTTSGTGYAWSENYGWIKFDCSAGSDSCVTTTWGGCAVDVCPNLPGDQATVPPGYELVGGQCIEIDEPPCTDCGTGGSVKALCSLTPNKVILGPGETAKISWNTNITSGNYKTAIFQGGSFDPENVNNQSFTVGPITGFSQYNASFSGDFVTGIASCSTFLQYDHCPLVAGIQSYGTSCTTEEPLKMCINRNSTQSNWLNQSAQNYVTIEGRCLTTTEPQDYCTNRPGVTIQTWVSTGENHWVDSGYCGMTQPPEPPTDPKYCSNISGTTTVVWENQNRNNYVDINGNCLTFSSEKVCYNLHPDGLDEVPDGYKPTDSTNRTCVPDRNVISSIIPGGWGWVPQVVALVGLIASIPGFAIRILNLILAIPFYRRKRPWGVVYDSESKETLDPAYVSVYNADTNELIETRITDINGRYGFLLPKGNYYMTAQKTNYEFPSKKLPRQNSDGVYDNLYFGEPFAVTDDSQGVVITLNIPMDRLAEDWNQEEKRRLGFFRSITHNTKLWSTVSMILFILGFIFSAFVLTIDQSTWNVFVFILYVIFTILQLTGFGPVRSGTVRDKNNNIIPFAVVRVWNAHLGKEIAKRITNEYGQYYILVARGDYYVTIDVKNSTTGEYDRVFTSGTIRAVQGIINENFKNI